MMQIAAPNKLEKGKIVTATVAKTNYRGGYLMDIGDGKNAFLPRSEVWLDANATQRRPIGQGWVQLDVGQVHEALVLNVLNDAVNISIARAQKALAWERISQLAQFDATYLAKVIRVTETGARVSIENVAGFIPWSHWQLTDEQSLVRADLIGSTVKVKFLELDRKRERIVLSHRRWLVQSKMKDLQPGQLVKGKVERLLPYGSVIRLTDGLVGLLHISQISKAYVASPSDVFKIGDEVSAIVIKFELSDGSLSLSTKMMEAQPGEILTDGRDQMFSRASSVSPDGVEID